MDNPAFTDDRGILSTQVIHRSDATPTIIITDVTADGSPTKPLSVSHASSASPASKPVEYQAVRLKRAVGSLSAICVILGTMIGAGIFISSQMVLARTGSVGLSLCVWLGCGVLSTLGGLCYIELGMVIPKSGGEFVYFLDSFGPLHEFFGPLSAFLYAWMTCLVTRPANTAIQSLVFAEYCIRPFLADECSALHWGIPLIAICAACVASFVNSYSVRLSTDMLNISSVVKLTVIVAILGASLYSLSIGTGTIRHLATGFQGSVTSASEIATAFYGALWAYDGWNNLNFLTEELVNPGRDLPFAIVVSIPMVTLLYILVNSAYLTLLSPEQLVASPAVAVTFAEHGLGVLAVTIPIAVATSVYGALNGTVLTTSRICFTAARHGHFSDALGLIHRRFLTPVPAVLFNLLLAAAMIAAGDIDTLIDFSSFTVWLFYGLAMVALLVLRVTRPHVPRPFRVPIWMPWLVLLTAIYVVISPVIGSPRMLYLYSVIFLFVGVFVYRAVIYRKRILPGNRLVTEFVQKLLEAVPSD